MKKIAIVIIVQILFICNIFGQNQDSLKKLLPTVSDNEKIEIYNKLSESYNVDFPDTALIYSNKALELSLISENQLHIAHSRKILGDALTALQKFDEAISEYNKSIDIYNKIKKDLLKANVFERIGRAYEGLNKYPDAIDVYQKALTIFEIEKDSTGISLVLNDIGAVYIALQNFPKAIEYLEQSLIIREKLGDLNGVSIILNNIGIIYDSMGNPEKALEYYNKSLEINEKLGNKQVIAYLLHNIGILYENKQKYKEAKVNYLKSLEISKELGDDYGSAYTLTHLGIISRETKNFDEALANFSESLRLARKISNREVVYQTYLEYSKTYKILGNISKALEYHELYSIVKDSVFNEDMHKQIAEMEAKFNAEKKEKENQLLRKDKELDTAKIKRQNLIGIGIGIVLLLVIILAVVFIVSSIRRKRANIILARQNIEISQQKEEIQAQAEELETINSELEKLSIVASETDNAVIIMNKDGDFEWVNKSFTRIYGVTIEEFKLKHGKNFKETSVNPDINNLIDYCISNAKSVSYESYYKPDNSEDIWLQTTLTPICNVDGSLKKLIAIESNITEIKKAEEEIIAQKEELQYKNQQINSSINYAKTIQKAMLPVEEDINKYFENFIIYRPKDIVSGDFYQTYSFLNENGQRCFFIAVVDCTGHGVPGAFMSMIGMRLFNEIINERKVQNPSEVLDLVNDEVISSLKQSISANNDGMDAAICKISPLPENRYEIVFSGAKLPLWVCKNNTRKIDVYKGTRKSIGGFSGNRNDEKFEAHTIIADPGDEIFMFSDGFKDQNNSERVRFGSQNLENALLDIVLFDLKTQKIKLEDALDNWQKDESQRDDITFLGLRF